VVEQDEFSYELIGDTEDGIVEEESKCRLCGVAMKQTSINLGLGACVSCLGKNSQRRGRKLGKRRTRYSFVSPYNAYLREKNLADS